MAMSNNGNGYGNGNGNGHDHDHDHGHSHGPEEEGEEEEDICKYCQEKGEDLVDFPICMCQGHMSKVCFKCLGEAILKSEAGGTEPTCAECHRPYVNFNTFERVRYNTYWENTEKILNITPFGFWVTFGVYIVLTLLYGYFGHFFRGSTDFNRQLFQYGFGFVLFILFVLFMVFAISTVVAWFDQPRDSTLDIIPDVIHLEYPDHLRQRTRIPLPPPTLPPPPPQLALPPPESQMLALPPPAPPSPPPQLLSLPPPPGQLLALPAPPQYPAIEFPEKDFPYFDPLLAEYELSDSYHFNYPLIPSDLRYSDDSDQSDD